MKKQGVDGLMIEDVDSEAEDDIVEKITGQKSSGFGSKVLNE